MSHTFLVIYGGKALAHFAKPIDGRPVYGPLKRWSRFSVATKILRLSFACPKMTPTILLSMIQGLRDMHKETGGRTEIRFGTQVVFLGRVPAAFV